MCLREPVAGLSSTSTEWEPEPQACLHSVYWRTTLIERGSQHVSRMAPGRRHRSTVATTSTTSPQPVSRRATLSQTNQRKRGRPVSPRPSPVLHDPAYREANAGALRMEWPRIPLPGWPTPGSAGILPASDAAKALTQSAARGRELAALLDPETPVPGVTTGTLRPDIATIAVPATVAGRNMTGDDFALTAGWGHYGTGDAVMPGQGRVVERAYTRTNAPPWVTRQARSVRLRSIFI